MGTDPVVVKKPNPFKTPLQTHRNHTHKHTCIQKRCLYFYLIHNSDEFIFNHKKFYFSVYLFSNRKINKVQTDNIKKTLFQGGSSFPRLLVDNEACEGHTGPHCLGPRGLRPWHAAEEAVTHASRSRGWQGPDNPTLLLLSPQPWATAQVLLRKANLLQLILNIIKQKML